MLLIIDNGNGAEDISRFLRMKHDIVTPKDAQVKNVSGIIITSGTTKYKKENNDIIKKINVPVLAFGVGSVMMCAAFGSKMKEIKPEKKKIVKIQKSCPLLLDFKKTFNVQDSCAHIIEGLPEGFDVAASSPQYEFEIFQGIEQPFFGVHFDATGPETIKMLHNFEKFIEIWEKYHKN